MSPTPSNRQFFPSELEQKTRASLRSLYDDSPIPAADRLEHLEVYMRPQRISEIISLDFLYRQALGIHGVIMEFGRIGISNGLVCEKPGKPDSALGGQPMPAWMAWNWRLGRCLVWIRPALTARLALVGP